MNRCIIILSLIGGLLCASDISPDMETFNKLLNQNTKLVISGPSPATTSLSTDTSLSAVSAYYSPVVINLPETTGAPFKPVT